MFVTKEESVYMCCLLIKSSDAFRNTVKQLFVDI